MPDQYVVNYSIHQTTNDVNTLNDHLKSHYTLHKSYPSTLTADSGYGSEENFELLDELNIDGFVKYTSFDRDQQGKDEPFKSENFHYNKEQDSFYCPKGQEMKKVKQGKRITTKGFEQKVAYYMPNTSKVVRFVDLAIQLRVIEPSS